MSEASRPTRIGNSHAARELLSLRWEHIDLKRKVLHLPDTKNGSSRNVPLSSRAVSILEKLPRNLSGKVFSTSETAITEGFQRVVIRAKIPDFRFHDLRHEATSRLAEKLEMHELGKVTGHKSPDVDALLPSTGRGSGEKTQLAWPDFT